MKIKLQLIFAVAIFQIVSTTLYAQEQHDHSTNLARGINPEDFDTSVDPNVDFYSGLIYRAIGIPTEMFTVMFALGRMPGWIAQWKEMIESPSAKIGRPRQIYNGATLRPFVAIEKRG